MRNVIVIAGLLVGCATGARGTPRQERDVASEQARVVVGSGAASSPRFSAVVRISEVSR